MDSFIYSLIFSSVLLCTFAQNFVVTGNLKRKYLACEDSRKVTLAYESGRGPDEENEYELFIKHNFEKYSTVEIRFDGGATVKLVSN